MPVTFVPVLLALKVDQLFRSQAYECVGNMSFRKDNYTIDIGGRNQRLSQSSIFHRAFNLVSWQVDVSFINSKYYYSDVYVKYLIFISAILWNVYLNIYISISIV